MSEAEIIAEQKKKSYKPYVRCHFTKEGGTTYTYTTADAVNRILAVHQYQNPYKETVEIVLQNAGQALTDINLKGYDLTLGFGFIINGSPDYIDQPPLKVTGQRFDSREGSLTLTINAKGIMSQIDDDKSSGEFTAGDTDTMKDLIEDILDHTLAVYSHCTAYISDWTGVTLDTDVNLFNPAGNFQIFLNSKRLDMLRFLLDKTYVFMRPKSDGTIEIIKPVTTGVVYDYEYELLGDHTFYIKEDARRVTIPNCVTVYGGEYDENTDTWPFSGTASESSPYKDVYHFEAYESITSNSQCSSVAHAILANFNMNRRTCIAIVPMNCTQKLFDYIKITDVRQGDSVVGNVGYIERSYESGSYRMEIGFGGWLEDRKVADFVSRSRRPVIETQATWVTVSLSQALLEIGDIITFHQIPQMIGGADRLYVKAYSVFGQPYWEEGEEPGNTVKLKILQNGEVKWSKEADTTKILWTEAFVGVTDDGYFDFVVENEVIPETVDPVYKEAIVTAFITYGLRTTGPA